MTRAERIRDCLDRADFDDLRHEVTGAAIVLANADPEMSMVRTLDDAALINGCLAVCFAMPGDVPALIRRLVIQLGLDADFVERMAAVAGA